MSARRGLWFGYVRQSEDVPEGIERQSEDVAKLAATQGVELTEIIADNDRSASTGARRPGYERLMAAVSAGQVAGILVQHLDRLYRRPVELEALLKAVEGRGVSIIAAQGGELDLGTDAGRLAARILVSVARAEVERKGARQKRAREAERAAGLSRFSTRPYGYRRGKDGQAVIVPREAERVREWSRRIRAGETLAQLAREMNARGVATTHGRAWQGKTVRDVLLSPRTAGLVAYETRTVTPEGRRGVHREIVGSGAWEPILPPDEQEALREILAAPGRRFTADARPRCLLAGIGYCGTCGAKLKTTHGRGRLRYRCSSDTSHGTTYAEPVDMLLDELVPAALLSAGLGDGGPGVEELAAEQSELRGRRQALLDMLERGDLSPGEVAERVARLSARLRELDEQRAALVTGSDFGNRARAARRWQEMGLPERRALTAGHLRVELRPARGGDPRDMVSVAPRA